MPRLPHKVTVDVTKCHACHTKKRGITADQPRPSASPEPAQCQKCHACHTKWRPMSPSATPTKQSDRGCRQARLPQVRAAASRTMAFPMGWWLVSNSTAQGSGRSFQDKKPSWDAWITERSTDRQPWCENSKLLYKMTCMVANTAPIDWRCCPWLFRCSSTCKVPIHTPDPQAIHALIHTLLKR